MPPRISYASPDDPPVQTALIRGLERLTGRRQLERHYASTAGVDVDSFWAAALDQLDVTPADPGAVVPSEGPVVGAANHPFGVLDGLAICRLVSEVCPRFRILVNSALCRDDGALIVFPAGGVGQRRVRSGPPRTWTGSRSWPGSSTRERPRSCPSISREKTAVFSSSPAR